MIKVQGPSHHCFNGAENGGLLWDLMAVEWSLMVIFVVEINGGLMKT